MATTMNDPLKKINGFADRRKETTMRILVCMMFLACLSPPFYAQERSERGAESKILAFERVGMQAFRGKDLRTLDSILYEDFVCVDEKGAVMTKAQMLGFVQSADSLDFLTDAMVVRLHGDTAIVTGLFRLKGATKGKAFIRQGRFVDTWIQKKSGWVMIATLWTPAM